MGRLLDKSRAGQDELTGRMQLMGRNLTTAHLEVFSNWGG